MGDRERPLISVVTPTLDRPDEVRALLQTLSAQQLLPLELVLVDGAPAAVRETEDLVRAVSPILPFECRYIRHGGGTAIQRNVGIDVARGKLVAFIDDDMRLEPDFFTVMAACFESDARGEVGGIAGYITNQHLDPARSPRWRWYRRLKLFGTYEPGRFDVSTGYPINRYLQPPHDGIREIDFMGSNCAVWRRAVIDAGVRFAPFFVDYGVMEDAHFALQAKKHGFRLLECGRARCQHLHSPRGRTSRRRVARKSAVNYRFLFVDTIPKRTWGQEFRWWRVQFVDLVRTAAYAIRRGGREEWGSVLGKVEWMLAACRVRPGMTVPP